jgi:hypothetical protein
MFQLLKLFCLKWKGSAVLNGLEVSELRKRVYTHIEDIIPHITGRGKSREWA